MLCSCTPLLLPDIDQLNISFRRESATETSLTIEAKLSGRVDSRKFENTRLVDSNRFTRM